MPDGPAQPTKPDDFFADTELRRAPRTHPMFARVLAGVAAGLFIGGGLWGIGQVAYGVNRADLNLGAPQRLAMAQTAYYAANGKYTTDLGALSALKEGRFAESAGIQAEVLGVCPSGWVARLDGTFTGLHTYVASTTSSNIATADSLGKLTLPACITVEDLQTKGFTAAEEAAPVTITDVKVARTSMATDTATTDEAARVSWSAEATCAAKEKPHYQVTVQEQQPAAQASGAYPLAGEFDLRTIVTTKKSATAANFYNGATYAIAVRGSCTTDFAAAQPVTKTFTQALVAPYIKVRVSGGRAYPIVWGTTYPYVSYDIQYRRSYASGWTTLVSGWVRDGALNADGYTPNYGDQFRARVQTLDAKQTSDWGPTATAQYAGYSAGYSPYNQYQSYQPYGR